MQFNLRFVWGFLALDLGWIRVFRGHGFGWKDVQKHGRLFSERQGIRRTIKIGRYQLKTFYPEKDGYR